MTSPFGCGPNPCEWVCRPALPPSCTVYSQNVEQGIDPFEDDAYLIISGTWNAGDDFSIDNGATVLNKTPMPDPELHYHVTFGNVFVNNDYETFYYIKSASDHSVYMYARIELTWDINYAYFRLSIGTEAGELAFKILTVSMQDTSAEIKVCYKDGILKATAVDEFIITADPTIEAAVPDNDQNYVGFGNGVVYDTAPMRFFLEVLSYHYDATDPSKVTCPDCSVQPAVAMRRGKPYIPKGKRKG